MKKSQLRIVTLLLGIFTSILTMAQIQISGIVLDEKGESLPGVNIQTKGTTKSSVTDLEGKFSVNVPGEGSILVFSYIGYEKNEIKIEKTRYLKVTLKEESRVLNEVMVIGYGDVKKADATVSVSKVEMTDLIKAPVMSVDQALAGRIAGVNVSSSEGIPGGTMNIVIRGNNSLTQANSPLYVIDGFPVEDATIASTLNMNDIESTTVLKDASATAIYGARGANGVIIITTKKGSVGAPRVTYDGSYGIQHPNRIIPLLDAFNFVKLQQEIYTPTDMIGNFGYLKTYNGKTYTLDDYKNVAQYNWQNKILQDAPIQSHNLSITGGTEDIRYNGSLSYFSQDGIVIKSGFDRVQGRFGVNIHKNKLTINLNDNYTSAISTGYSPSQSIYSGMFNLFYSVWGYRPVTQPGVDLNSLLDYTMDPSVDPTNDYRFNPVMSLNNEYNKKINRTNQYNGFVEYEIFKGLKLKSSGGYTIQENRAETFNNSKTRYGSPISTEHVNATLATEQRNTWLNENTLSYQTKFDKVHTINALVGMTMQGSNYNFYSLHTKDIPNENMGMAGMTQGTPALNTSVLSEWSLLSYLGRINYNYKSKYYMTASFRADASSKFPSSNRWAYFPSASLGWNFMSENFMSSLKPVIQSGKLRASWGQTGNNRIGEYDSYTQMQISQGIVYPFNNVEANPSAIFTSLGNSQIKWETTAQTDIGLDLNLLRDKVTVTVDWYNKITSDLLLQATLPGSSGFTSAMKNIGSVKNQGLEFSVNTTNIVTKKFRWTSSFNISFNQNKVLALSENQITLMTSAAFDQGYKTPNYIAKIGYLVGLMYGYKYLGTYKYDDFNNLSGVYTLKPGIANYAAESSTQPGMPKYADLNHDGVINDKDQTIIGNGNPVHIGGFTNNFEYAGFDLSVFFQWSYGNNVMNANLLFFDNGMKTKDRNMYADYANRWTTDNPTSDIPRVSNSSSNNLISSRIIEDGSYIRLKTLSLGYTLNSRTIKKLKMSKARFFVSAQNLLTFTNYSGYDPEVSIRNSALTPGLDFSAYPRASTLVFGVNLGL